MEHMYASVRHIHALKVILRHTLYASNTWHILNTHCMLESMYEHTCMCLVCLRAHTSIHAYTLYASSI